MRKIVLLLFVILSCLLKAQEHVSGIVVDEHQEPVAFASISLLQETDSAFVGGTTSDENGRFLINDVPTGKLLRISYVGYRTQYVHPSADMRIEMKSETLTVGDVVIKGSRPTYKMKGGALVAPVENTVLAKLGDANDVLAQLPLISKKDNEYSVIGHGTPLIYINNRLMRDPQELEEIKSSSIKDVKIELNPGTKYSSEVGAIIKITTLRPVGEGLGGSLSSYYKRTNRNAFSELVNLNYRHHGLDVFFNGQYNDRQAEQDQRDSHAFSFNGIPHIASKNGVIGSRAIRIIKLTAGLNYSFNEKQLAGIRYTYNNTLNATNYMDFNVIYREGDSVTEYETHQIKKYPSRWNQQLNAFYQNELSKVWQLNVDATYADNLEETEGHQQENRFNAPSDVSYTSNTKSRLWALKAWNIHHLWGGSAEWGFETTFTRNSNSYQMLNEEVAEYIPSTDSRSDQKANSLFISYSHAFSSLNITFGLRYEHVNMDYWTNGVYNQEASKVYNNLFPSLSVSYQKGRSNVSLSYRTIVKRPTYYQLRSEVQYNNSYSAEGGNPELQPAYIHRFSLTMQHRNFVFDASYNIDDNNFFFYTLPVTTRPMAIASFVNSDMKDYNMSLTYSPTFGIWKTSLTASLVGQVLHIDGISHSGIGVIYQWQNLISLPQKWLITCNMSGSSAAHYQNTWQYSRFNCDFSVRKDIGSWQFTCGVNDIFNTSRSRWSKEDNGVTFEKWNNPHNHGVYIRVQYSFNPAKSKYKGGQAGQSELNRF